MLSRRIRLREKSILMVWMQQVGVECNPVWWVLSAVQGRTKTQNILSNIIDFSRVLATS